MTATVEIRRAADRAVTTTSWLKSRHSFSFGDHYDPDNTHHGLLLVNNDDQMEPASGFDPHPHRDMENRDLGAAGSAQTPGFRRQ